MKLVHYIKTWARLLRIQIPMPHNEGLGVLLVKLLQQISQSDTLGFRPCIHRLSVFGKTANVAHANGMSVMVSAMCPDLLFGPACFDGTVRRNHVVVSTAIPAQRTMVTVDVRQAELAARLIGGTVYDD